MPPSRQAHRLARVAGMLVTLTTLWTCGGTAPAPPAAPAATGGAGAPPAPAVADVKLDLLKSASSSLPDASRNPFQFQARASVTAPTARAAAARRGPVLPVAPAAPVVSGPPPLPAIALRYIGVADTERGRIAMLKEPGGDILSGREGDIIDGRYRLLRVGPDSADLAYADGRGRQTIRLSGQ